MRQASHDTTVTRTQAKSRSQPLWEFLSVMRTVHIVSTLLLYFELGLAMAAASPSARSSLSQVGDRRHSSDHQRSGKEETRGNIREWATYEHLARSFPQELSSDSGYSRRGSETSAVRRHWKSLLRTPVQRRLEESSNLRADGGPGKRKPMDPVIYTGISPAPEVLKRLSVEEHGPLVKRDSSAISGACGSFANRCKNVQRSRCVRACVNGVSNRRVCKVLRRNQWVCVVFSSRRRPFSG